MPSKSSGFSLIEVLIVVAVIAILAGLILMAAQRSQLKAHDNSIRADIRQMRVLAENAYVAQGNSYQNWATAGPGFDGIAAELTILKKDIDVRLADDPDDATYQVTIIDTNEAGYCLSAPLRATSNHFCADATGVFKEVASACDPAANPPRCPAS